MQTIFRYACPTYALFTIFTCILELFFLDSGAQFTFLQVNRHLDFFSQFLNGVSCNYREPPSAMTNLHIQKFKF